MDSKRRTCPVFGPRRRRKARVGVRNNPVRLPVDADSAVPLDQGVHMRSSAGWDLHLNHGSINVAVGVVTVHRLSRDRQLQTVCERSAHCTGCNSTARAHEPSQILPMGRGMQLQWNGVAAVDAETPGMGEHADRRGSLGHPLRESCRIEECRGLVRGYATYP